MESKSSVLRGLGAFILVTGLVFAMQGSLLASEAGDETAITKCLAAWGKHPFKGKNPSYRTLRNHGKNHGYRERCGRQRTTSKPELILIKPAVNVMTKTAFRLLNPNGWYCFASNVTVMGVSAITAACSTHLASAHDGVAVAGSNTDTEGVTVLGKAEVTRVDCPSK